MLMPSVELNGKMDQINSVFQRNFDEAVSSGQCLYHVTPGINFEALWFNWLPDYLFKQNCCSTCGKFLKDYGGLVTINDDGTVESVLFKNKEGFPEEYLDSVNICESSILKFPEVVSVFKERADLKIVGIPESEGFHHFHHLERKINDPCFTEIRGLFNWTYSIIKQIEAIEAIHGTEPYFGFYVNNFIRRVTEKHPEYCTTKRFPAVFQSITTLMIDLWEKRFKDNPIKWRPDPNILNNKNLDEITWSN